MPRAKRNKEVTLSKVKPKGRDHKENQLTKLQASVSSNPYCYLFSVGNMRNNHLKEVREKWKGSSIYWGMNGVARKALGMDEGSEVGEGIREISKRLQGPVGLLFTTSPPSETLPWFASYSASSYLRGGQISPKTVVLAKGPVKTASQELGGQNPDEENLNHSIEPQLRKLGLPTELKMGVPTLLRDFEVCKKGKVVSTENAQILKHILLPLSTFRIIPLSIYTNPLLSSSHPDPDASFSKTYPSLSASTSLNPQVQELKLNEEEQAQVDEGMKGVNVGKKTGGGGKVERRKTRKEAMEEMKKGGAGDEMDEDDEDADEEMEMGDDAVGESMMLPDSMKVV